MLFFFVDIIGDGNCFYRCLSNKHHGNQEHYKKIREEIVSFMEGDNSVEEKQYKIERYYGLFGSHVKKENFDDSLGLVI